MIVNELLILYVAYIVNESKAIFQNVPRPRWPKAASGFQPENRSSAINVVINIFQISSKVCIQIIIN